MSAGEACILGATIGAGSILGLGAMSKSKGTTQSQGERSSMPGNPDNEELDEAIELALRILKKRRS
jgi:hypothetical protein